MIDLTLKTNARKILDDLHEFPAAMQQESMERLDQQNEFTIGHIQATKLSGPRPGKLGVVTNRLRSSISRAPARLVKSGEIISSIGTNVRYARAHEEGFDGSVEVDAHQRRRFGARGSGERVRLATAIFDPQTGRISRRKTKVKYVTATVSVRAHKRRMKMPARPFIWPSLRERAPEYFNSLSEGVVFAWKGGRP